MGGVSTMRVLNVTFGFGSRDGRARGRARGRTSRVNWGLGYNLISRGLTGWLADPAVSGGERLRVLTGRRGRLR